MERPVEVAGVRIKKDAAIDLCGNTEHGVQTLEQILTKILRGKTTLEGVYENPERRCFEDTLAVYHDDGRPLFERNVDFEKLQKLIDSTRGM